MITKITNIAQLRARKGTVNALAETLGYYTPSDGGGNTYQWNISSVLADNGGSVIAVTGVATRSYVNNNAWLHKTSQNSTVATGTFVFGDLDDAGQSVTFGCHYTSLGLTSAEHAILNTRINTLMTAVGR